MSTCACDPTRLYQTLRTGPFETIASVSDSCWLRCQQCGRWLWVLDDNSRFQVWLTWELDGERAARAARERSLDAVLDLLLSHNAPHGLPYGPVWESPRALLHAIPKLANGVDSRTLLAALEQRQLPERWREARDCLRAERASDAASLAAVDYPFAIDERLDLAGIEVTQETHSGFRLARLSPRCRVFEVTSRGVEPRDLPGAARHVGQADGELLLDVNLEVGRALIRIDAAGTWSTAACSNTVNLVAHDAELWFLAAPTAAGSLIEVRRRDLTEVAALRVRGAALQLYPAKPVRFGDAWVIPNAVIDTGRAVPFALWHAARGLGPAAPASDLIVSSVWVVGEVVVTVAREKNRDRVELWRVLAGRIERVGSYGEIQSSLLVDGVLVLKTLSAGTRFVSTLLGVGLDGAALWDMRIEGLVDISATGRCVRARWGARGVALDARSGRVERELRADIAVPALADETGTEYHAGRRLRLVRDLDVVHELTLDGEYRVVTTLGDAAVLELGARLLDTDGSCDPGHCLVVSQEGKVRGRFVAPRAIWSVIGTVGGPYVVEPERLRIGKLGSVRPVLADGFD